MSKLFFRVFVDEKLYGEFQGKEIKEFLTDWDGKLQNGSTLKTTEGNSKVVNVAILNPDNNDGKQITEIFLEKV